jgi:membrane protease YdiL (CAAX protease family)
MSYQAQTHLSDAARPRIELWRLIIGVVLISVLTLLLSAVWIFAQAWIFRTTPGAITMGETPVELIAMLFSFVCAGLALWAVMAGLHRRGLGSLIVAAPLTGADAFGQFWRCFAGICVILGVALLIPMPDGLTPEQAKPFGDWVKWVPLALPALLIQTGAEELIFRGYLQSQLASRFRSPVIWMVLPSALFAVLHFDSTAGANAWAIVGVTFLFGLVAADLTARSGSLGPAIALHMGNNISSVLFVGLPGSLSGLALYLLPVEASDPALRILFPVEALLLLLIWLAARVAIRR